MATALNLLEYDGSNFMRQRLILSTLSGRSLKISNIRPNDEFPGLRDYEVNLLKLIDQITNGSKIDINSTGTAFFYQPGLLHGGSFEFDCELDRGIGFYLELLLTLAPFCKISINAKLWGVTHCKSDLSPEYIKFCWLPIAKKFLLDTEDLDIKVTKRGLAPEGGGQVQFTSPICRNFLRPLHLTKQGKIKKIRGVAYSCRVSPMLANRLVDSMKKVLRRFTPNVYIYVDSRKGPASGNSPGFGATLYAETTDGGVFGAEGVSNPVGTEPICAEDLGHSIGKSLVEEIYRGGCVDSTVQGFSLLYMVLGQKDVSKLVLGPLSVNSIHYLRYIRDFFQTTFQVENFNPSSETNCKITEGEDEAYEMKLGDKNKVLLTCVGVGYANINKVLL